MAETFLEAIGILQGFGLQYLFVPILFFIIAFGVLMKSKLISDKMDVNGAIALIVALLISMNPGVSSFFYYFLPLITAFLLIFFGGILLFLFFGANTQDIAGFFRSAPAWIFVIVMFFVFFIMSMIWAFPGEVYPTVGAVDDNGTVIGPIDSSSQYSISDVTGPFGFIVTISNPRVLGLIAFMLLIGIIGTVIAYQKA